MSGQRPAESPLVPFDETPPALIFKPERADNTASTYRAQLWAVEHLLGTAWHAMSPAWPAQDYHLVLESLFIRASLSYKSVANLLRAGLVMNAEMLVRPLFEDMVAAYWTALPANQEKAPRRIEAQQEQIALIWADLRERTSSWREVPVASRDPDLEGRRDELTQLFGKYGEGSWFPSLYLALREIRPVWERFHDLDQLDNLARIIRRSGNEWVHPSAFALLAASGGVTRRKLGPDEDYYRAAFGESSWCYYHLAHLALVEMARPVDDLDRAHEIFLYAYDRLWPSEVRRLPRNSLCPCGSNRKVKQCHGR